MANLYTPLNCSTSTIGYNNINYIKYLAVLPAIQVTETSRKETATVIEPETDEVETMACQGMEARPEEEKPTSLETKPEATQQEEVPVEHAEVIPVGEPKKKRRRDRKLAAEHRRQKTNTSTRENCGPQERLAVTHRGRTHRATVARHMSDIFRPNTTRHVIVTLRKGIARKNWVMNSVLRGTVTGQTPGRRRRQKLECSKDIKSQM
jgi:hypothetical protein